jgi:hypothetical protein
MYTSDKDIIEVSPNHQAELINDEGKQASSNHLWLMIP